MILDEPTAGDDLELRHEFRRYIRRLHERGTTILLTTHYLEEAEALCEEIALIGKGRIMARDTAAGLKERFDAATLEDVYMKTVAAGRREVDGSARSPRLRALLYTNHSVNSRQRPSGSKRIAKQLS